MHRNDQATEAKSDLQMVTVIDMSTGQVSPLRASASSSNTAAQALPASNSSVAGTNTIMFRHGSPLMPRTRVGPRGAGPIVWPVGFDEMFADGVQDR